MAMVQTPYLKAFCDKISLEQFFFIRFKILRLPAAQMQIFRLRKEKASMDNYIVIYSATAYFKAYECGKRKKEILRTTGFLKCCQTSTYCCKQDWFKFDVNLGLHRRNSSNKSLFYGYTGANKKKIYGKSVFC